MKLAFIPPCLAKSARALPTGDAWVHEPKLDGFRLQVVKDRDGVRLYSKRGADWTKRLHALAESLQALPASTAILDCELVYVDDGGHIDFGKLMRRATDGLNVFAFDLLFLNGRSLIDRSWAERRKRLRALLERTRVSCLHAVAAFENGPTLFAAADKMGLEGVVSKRKDRPYRSGASGDWLKVKTDKWKEANRERWRMFRT